MEITTTDLMYAAFLVCTGAQIVKFENCGRYTKLVLQVPNYSLKQGNDKSDRLCRLFSRAECLTELPVIYEQSVIKNIADTYYNIKKSIARSRNT